jgi:DNA invertase Pin-like site-specific DNA recombinase
MTDLAKIQPTHLGRDAFVYLRQSTATQLERNLESTRRQYALADRAVALGWSRARVRLIDQDLGVSGSGMVDRGGFATLTTEVALGHAGIVLGIEVSRLARNNAEWYRLLDLCGITDTLIADADGIYHPALFNDRLVLGLKGTMSEAELHLLRARLDGGIRNKAARGELRRGLPVGLVWGEEDGEVRFHPDEAVRGAIGTVFERFAEMGSVRQVWLWFRSHNLSFPRQSIPGAEIRWVPPTYASIHNVLTSPVYAGAYAYGKTRQECYVDETGRLRKRTRRLPRSQWAVLLPEHHEGYINWETYDANLARIAANTHPQPHQPGGAVREGAALLQGIATCGRCGRRLRVLYQGKNSTPGYYCAGNTLVNGRGVRCLQVGGCQIDEAVSDVFLRTIAPAGLEAALAAEASLEADHDAALAQGRLEVERLRYEAERAERRYRAVEPENRLVARGLESDWEKRLQELATAEAQLARRGQNRPRALTAHERDAIHALGADVRRVWHAPTTTDRDRKELLRTLLEEVNISLDRVEGKATLTLRWRGGLFTELVVDVRRVRTLPCRTDEDTIDLIRRLAVHYPDATIAGVLNRQGRKTARGERFTAHHVGCLRRYRKIARFTPPLEPPAGELATVARAAQLLGVAPSTVHRWLADGFIAGEQLTPGAPWRIRITEELKARFVEEEQAGYLPMIEATKALGVSRQTVLQRVKRGELEAAHVRQGRRKGLRIKVVSPQPGLFDERS